MRRKIGGEAISCTDAVPSILPLMRGSKNLATTDNVKKNTYTTLLVKLLNHRFGTKPALVGTYKCALT